MTAVDLSFPAPSLAPVRDSSRPLRARMRPGTDRGTAQLARAVCMAMRVAVFRMVEPRGVLDVATLTFQEATRHFQRGLLLSHLEASGWNVAKTARRLDLARSHVYNLMGSMQIERPEGARGTRRRARMRD